MNFGDEGEWRSQGRNGQTLANYDPAPHDFGHLLGLKNRYSDNDKGNSEPDEGWENNIMANGQKGKVEQRNVDEIVGDALKAYEIWSKDKKNKDKDKEFKYEID